MRRLPFLWVDVFTDRPLAGNPLCVVLAADSLSAAEMQAIARETNLSETTFVLPPTRPSATYRVRIFTPGGELPFAGHPTLGTAAALVHTGRAAAGALVQESAAGLTPVECPPGGPVRLRAPAAHLAGAPDPAAVAGALGVPAAAVTAFGLRPEVWTAGISHLLVPVDSPEALASLHPDPERVSALCRTTGAVGVYPLTLLRAGAGAAARARLFAPLYGVAEDPATGSAACLVGPYLERHQRLPATAFWYEQGVEMGRPSRLQVERRDDGWWVGGGVAAVAAGEFTL